LPVSIYHGIQHYSDYPSDDNSWQEDAISCCGCADMPQLSPRHKDLKENDKTRADSYEEPPVTYPKGAKERYCRQNLKRIPYHCWKIPYCKEPRTAHKGCQRHPNGQGHH